MTVPHDDTTELLRHALQHSIAMQEYVKAIDTCDLMAAFARVSAPRLTVERAQQARTDAMQLRVLLETALYRLSGARPQ